MKKRLMTNLGLKIVALLFAAVLWLLVVNINDPVEKKTYRDITVKILHDEIITNRGKTYRIQNESNKVSVLVTAKRSVLEKIRTEDIVATADVKEMELSTLLPIRVSITGYDTEYKSVAATPNNVEIKQETSIYQNYPIVVEPVGTLQDGYILKEATAKPVSVQFTGPKSLIGRIDKVVARVDIDGISEDSVLDADLTLYDGGGNILDQTLLENNLGRDDKSAKVQVKIALLATKSVPIELDTSGIHTAKGYKLSEITCEPERIQLAGEADEIQKLEKLTIPAEALTAEDIVSKTERTVDLSEYLPDDIQLANENEKNIIVTIGVERLGMRTFDLAVDSIQRNNVPEGYKVSFGNVQEIELHFTGEDEALENLTMEQIQLATSIDLQGYTREGTYAVPIRVTLGNGCSLAEDVSVSVTLVKQEADVQQE